MFQAKSQEKKNRERNNNGTGTPNPKGANLSGRQKRQIASVIKNAKSDPAKPESVQASIPYIAMYPDGVCHVTGRVFSKTLEFEDINYMLAGKDEQTATFETFAICITTSTAVYLFRKPISAAAPDTMISKTPLRYRLPAMSLTISGRNTAAYSKHSMKRATMGLLEQSISRSPLRPTISKQPGPGSRVLKPTS